MTTELTGRTGRAPAAPRPSRGSPFRGAPRVAEAGPQPLGLAVDDLAAPYAPRPVDDVLENALGSDRPLVVVTGDRLAGASRAVHRALRRMLGDRRLLPIADPHTVELADALRLARGIGARSGPVVVLADDAPPALLDQIDRSVLDGDPAVRLVLTTRRTSLDAFLAPATRAVIDGALVTVPPAGDGRPIGEHVRPVGRARAVLDPAGWSSPVPLALLRTAVDWERLQVPLPLTSSLLVEVAPIHLAHLGVPAPEPGELRRAARDLLRADRGGMRLLREVPGRRGGTRLVPDRVFSHLADALRAGGDGAGWPVPEELARDLWHRLSATDRALVARVAMARGEDQVALWLATQVPPDDLEPDALYRLGVALAERSAAHAPEPGRWDRGALRWLTAALDRTDDDDLVRRAHHAILAIESRRDVRDRMPGARPPADAAPTGREPADSRL